MVAAKDKPAQRVEASTAPHLAQVRQYVPGGKDISMGYMAWLEKLYNPKVAFPLLLPFVASAGYLAYQNSVELTELYQLHLQRNVIEFMAALCVLIVALTWYLARRARPIYLIDFATFKPPREWHSDSKPDGGIMRTFRNSGFFGEDQAQFQAKLLKSAGLGNHTSFPEGLVKLKNMCYSGEIHNLAIDEKLKLMSMEAAREEAKTVMFAAIDELMEKKGLRSKDIDILVVNCSLFNPTPSLTAMIVNHYKLKSNILTYNLAGMGCSASVIAIDTAKLLLQVPAHSNMNAIVVSTENITQNFYRGNEKSMLITNTLFRAGGSAMLLSNKRSDRLRAKYELKCSVRTHKGADDAAYNCVFQKEDDVANVGVALSKDILVVAGNAVKSNITTLGPMVLPLTEQLKFFFNLVRRQYLKHKIPMYTPNFRKAFEHYCIHAGGRGVIDELKKNLQLSDRDVLPSRKTLFRYGNTSSSSVWYELEYIENHHDVQAGDRVWQIAFGSGFKCNSAVWRALRPIACHSPASFEDSVQRQKWDEEDEAEIASRETIPSSSAQAKSSVNTRSQAKK